MGCVESREFSNYTSVAMADKTWLTFENKERLGEPEIRAELEVFGPVIECDGAIGGEQIELEDYNVKHDYFLSDEGWVMVAVESKAKAQKAVKSLKVCFYSPLIWIANGVSDQSWE